MMHVLKHSILYLSYSVQFPSPAHKHCRVKSSETVHDDGGGIHPAQSDASILPRMSGLHHSFEVRVSRGLPGSCGFFGVYRVHIYTIWISSNIAFVD
jgi:hypothetical protein